MDEFGQLDALSRRCVYSPRAAAHARASIARFIDEVLAAG
jgi:hypothetical protein